MVFSFSSRLYAITDTRISGLSHAQQVAELCEGGAVLIQLREKQLAPLSFYQEAVAAVSEAHQRRVRVIINDRADIALAAGADGVHLGQEDLAPEAARRIMGSEAIVGFSTHTLTQAKLAAKLPIDYLAVGPIFATSTKIDPDPVIGLEGLSRIREVIGDLPLVAIGGITRETAAQVLAAGADVVAVVSALLAPPASISHNTSQFLQSFERPRPA